MHAQERKSQITARMKSTGVYQIRRSLTDSCIVTTDATITISIKRVQKHLQIERSSVTPFISGEQKAAVGAATLRWVRSRRRRELQGSYGLMCGSVAERDCGHFSVREITETHVCVWGARGTFVTWKNEEGLSFSIARVKGEIRQ